jgi:hypothetical protein
VRAHEFRLVAVGPPALIAACSCGEWRIVWDMDRLRAFASFEPALDALVNDWGLHVAGRAALEERAKRDAAFYA